MIEQRKGDLVVTLRLNIADVVSQRESAGEALQHRLDNYLAHVGSDLMDVTKILAEQGEVGKVKWFNEARGYGYIRTATSEDVFVHWRGISGKVGGFKTLKDGQQVRFKRRMGRESVEAIDVMPVGDDA